MLTKTRSVVLKEIKFRDQSKICSLYTRDFGRISVILKGGRNPKSRLSGLFSTGNLLEVVLYNRSNRDIQLVSEARIIRSPMTAEPSIERFSAVYRLIEMVKNSTGNEEKNVRLFDVLSLTLETLCRPCRNIDAAVAWFLLRLISDMGFEPSIEHCVVTGKPIMTMLQEASVGKLHLIYDPGGVALDRATTSPKFSGQLLPIPVYLLMRTLANLDISLIDDIDIPPDESRQLCDILQNYCSMHSEHQPPTKNRKIISQLLSNPEQSHNG